MDYYLIRGTGSVCLLIEEFTRHADGSASGRNNALWLDADEGWSSSAAFSRAVRTDPELRGNVLAVDRRRAEESFRDRTRGPLPTGTELRSYFTDFEPFPSAAPLSLTPHEPPPGFAQKRLYRALFAHNPAAPRSPAPEPADLARGEDRYTWRLHRVAGGAAWALDLTVLLASHTDATVGPVLDDLVTHARLSHGLIPVTIDRFY